MKLQVAVIFTSLQNAKFAFKAQLSPKKLLSLQYISKYIRKVIQISVHVATISRQRTQFTVRVTLLSGFFSCYDNW